MIGTTAFDLVEGELRVLPSLWQVAYMKGGFE